MTTTMVWFVSVVIILVLVLLALGVSHLTFLRRVENGPTLPVFEPEKPFPPVQRNERAVSLVQPTRTTVPTVEPDEKAPASCPSKSVQIQDRGRAFSFSQVENLSEEFSNRISDGTTYLVFKGILQDGTEVAVKRMRENLVDSSEEAAKFYLQVDLLHRVHHQHIVNLVGYCEQRPHRMLLSQYAPNGSLCEILHGDLQDELLTWKQRLRIAMGIAYGLRYLHHSCNPPIIHGKLTSDNILLTEDLAAKITGLGKVPLLRTVSLLRSDVNSTVSDDAQDQETQFSPADDVYSFGIILLELLSGRSSHSEETGHLADWAIPFLTNEEQTMGLMDPRMRKPPSSEFFAVCESVRLCIQSNSTSRPAITQVLDMLLPSSNMSVEVAAPMSSPVELRGLMAASSYYSDREDN